MIDVEINSKSVTAGIARMTAKIPSVVASANEAVAHEIMRLSQLEVPHDEGTLQNSGAVELLPNGDVVVGYHTKYAARLHEHPEYRFQKGRKGKYLEDPITKNVASLGITYNRTAQLRLF